MTYLHVLEDELTAAGIPAARRRRIVAEFADHLHECPDAELGKPQELARQFADELGTRLARMAAFRAFMALAFAGISMTVMFVAVGRMRGLTFGRQGPPTPTWTAPIMMVAALSAQVALAAGSLALLRAWRLRHERVISGADAKILARRAGVGLVGGMLTLAALPACAVAFPHAAGHTWTVFAWVLAGLGAAVFAATAPSVVSSFRLRPSSSGVAGDLISDLGGWAPSWLSPTRFALLFTLVIVVLMSVAGVFTDDPYDGIARGIADGLACLVGFAVLGRYLGLRSAGEIAQ
jgi:hypothetical protein